MDFMGIGVTKAGTTWVSKMLNAHPEVCMSEPKEIRYFNYFSPHKYKHYYEGRRELFLNKNYNKPFSWYKKHFRHCRGEKIKGEFSPTYLYDEKAAVSIRERFPDIKLIVCLRNPIDRAYSHYWMDNSYLKREDRVFEVAIQGKNIYVEGGYYYKQLQPYLDRFKRDKILIVLFDDIVNQPNSELKRIYSFLGVDSSFIPSGVTKKSNQAKKAVWRGIPVVMNLVPRFLVHAHMTSLLRFLRKLNIHEIVMNLATVRLDYPKMSPETREYLRDTFREDIKKLEVLLDRDLSHWR